MGSIVPEGAKGLSQDVFLLSLPSPPNTAWIAQIEAAHPGLTVRWVTQSLKYPPDPLPEGSYDDVTMLCTLWPHPAEMLPKVRYVQLISAGADKWITHDLYKNPNVTFCTANGVHA
jgi:hypothetical protein